MVTIKHFVDVTSKDHSTYQVATVAEFLRSSGLSKSEMLDLRFFHGDVLGSEIDTSDTSFLTIANGTVVVIDGKTIPKGPETWIYISIAIITAVVVSSLVSIPNTPSTGNTGSRSSTNALGATNNEPTAVNDRIDDIFGAVNYHIPKMWQYPYRVGINDQETEFLLLCVGRGKYDIDLTQIRDDQTRYINIPNAEANLYEPGTWPGNGSPSQVLNNVIDRPIGLYRESSSINATELLPPNDLSIGEEAIWSVVQSGTSATLTLNNAGSLDVDLQNYFAVSEFLTLIECWVDSNSTETIDRTIELEEGDTPVDDSVTINIATDMSGSYEITGVTSTTVTITAFTHDVEDDSIIRSTLYSINEVSGGAFVLYTVDSSFIVIDAYSVTYSIDGTDVTYSGETITADVGQAFDNVVGIFTIEQGVSKILINLTSTSGFYKIYKSTEKRIVSNVRIVVEETDSNGVPTGNSVVTNYEYSSNERAVTASVYRTVEIDIPYEYSRVYASRTGFRDKGDDITNLDKIEWTYLYTYSPLPEGTDFGDVTLLHCLIPSNSQSRLVKQRRTNLDVVRKLTQYLGNGSFGATEDYPTNDFAQILIHTALDVHCGRLSLDDINADALLSLRDSIVDYFGDSKFTEFGYDFDTTQMSYDDMFTLICEVVNCIPYVQSGRYDAFFEGEQTTSSYQITHRNKISGTEVREDVFENQYDSVELTYRNNETGDNETIYVPSDQSGTTPQTLELVGCTNTEQAQCRANRMYNRQIYERTTVTFDVDEFGRMIVPGQRIDSPDSTRFVTRENAMEGYRIYDGEVVEINGLVVELSQPVTFIDGENHYIQFTNTTGENSELILCTTGSNEFTVILSETPSQSIYDGYERDRTKFTFCSEQVRESIALIPKTIEVTIDSDGKETSTITSKNYDARIYQDDVRGS